MSMKSIFICLHNLIYLFNIGRSTQKFISVNEGIKKKLPLVNHIQIACIFRVTFLKERKEIENNPLNNFILDYFCPLWTRHTQRKLFVA